MKLKMAIRSILSHPLTRGLDLDSPQTRNLHHEPFDPDCPQWELPKGGPMSMANSALPWVVFERDRQRFEILFPEWRIEKIQLQAPFRYLLSGGVAYRSFQPPD